MYQHFGTCILTRFCTLLYRYIVTWVCPVASTGIFT